MLVEPYGYARKRPLVLTDRYGLNAGTIATPSWNFCEAATSTATSNRILAENGHVWGLHVLDGKAVYQMNEPSDKAGVCSRMGDLPPAGEWVRLEVPAAAVGLEGRSLTGAIFGAYDGKAWWDRMGKVRPARVTSFTSDKPSAQAAAT